MANKFDNTQGALLAAALLAWVGCGDNDKGEIAVDSTPNISITATTTMGTAPLTVQFFSTVHGGDGPLTYAWDLGDGATSDEPNPAHTFEASASPYTVTVTVTDDDGDTGTSSIKIVAGSDEEPTVMAMATPTSGAAPLVVDFNCTVAGGNQPVDVSWQFGDGTSDIAAVTAYTYTMPGTYRAQCRARDADGDLVTDSVDITVGYGDMAPTVAADVAAGACAVTGVTQVELDATASFDPEGAALQFFWSFVTVPPGSTATFNNATVANPTFVPDADGTYQVRVYVSDGVNIAASDVVVVQSSGPSNLGLVAGDAQTGGVGTVLPTDLVVEVTNECGALVSSAAIEWTGVNASADPQISFTDSDGVASTSVMLGSELGPASITATLLGTGETFIFTFTAVPGPVAQVLMDEAGPVQVGAPAPTTLTFRATDAFGNLVTEPVTFDVSLGVVPTSATIDDDGDNDCSTGGTTSVTVTTTDGIATVQLCNTTAEDVYVAIENVSAPSGASVMVGGRVTWRADDFETDTGEYVNTGVRNPWELGPPTYPPGLTGYSPVQVRGTVLDGELDTAGSFFGEVTSLETSADTTYPVGAVYSATLELNQFYDLEYSNRVACSSNAQLWAACYGCTLLTPDEGYNGSDCYFTGAPAYSGTNSDFTPVSFDLTAVAGTTFNLIWSVTYYEESGGAGWYIDDLRLWGLVEYPRVRFVAGAATEVSVAARDTGVVQACSPVTIAGTITDEFGNPSTASGVEVTLTASGNGEFVGVLVGTNFTPGATPNTATVETVDGAFSVLLADSAATAEDVTVTAAITGMPVGASGTTIATFNDPVAAENAVPDGCSDGVDNDCDGAIDCDDPDCSAEPVCLVEVCNNGLDDNLNGLTDCEDSQCHNTPECETLLTSGACNGIDDEDWYGVYGVDEFACNCVNNSGCDDIDYGDFGGPFVCQFGIAPLTPNGLPFCAPDCRLFDWCAIEGFRCDVGTGECQL